MAESDNGAIAHYRKELRSVFEGRKILLVGGQVAGLTERARQLRSLGAERPFIIGSSLGTGQLPTEEDAEWVSLELSVSSVGEALRAYENQLSHLPEEVRQRIDAYDPKRSAIALAAIVLGDVPQIGGRPRYGARPRSWAALEDKVTIDAFWDAVGVAHAPCRVVRPILAELLEAARRFDEGLGTIWAADAREGVHGGAEGLRWVRTEEQAREAVEFLATRSDRVRVSPFMEGIPCSIYGMVLPDGVAVFRPVEMITLRRAGLSRLMYAGAASFWDPPPDDREAMREIARRTALALGERVGFRGAFTIDGVLSEHGFRATELNPRIGAGLSVLENATAGLPLVLLALAAQAGQNLDYRPEELEEFVVAATDARRAGGAWALVHQALTQARSCSLVEEGNRYRLALENEQGSAILLVGPSELGCLVRYTPDPERVASGPSIAPRAIAAFELAEREFGIGFGSLTHASPRR